MPFKARLIGHIRVILHMALAATVIAESIVELLALSGGSGDRATAILMTGFGLAGLLGLLSLLTLFTLRAAHPLGSNLFFGLTVIILVLNIFSELLIVGWSDWTGDDPLHFALLLLMLVVGSLGFVVEHACDRLGVVSRWRLPWGK